MFLAIAAIYALRFTPLGRIANATRDSPERVSFIGFDPKLVSFLMFCLSATFAGLAGGLYAVNYEIMTPASLGYRPTSMVIVMVYIGGVRQFGGPILGAFLITLVEINLASYTGAWQLYLGILFVFVIMFAPDGLAGFLSRHVPVVRARLAHLLLPAYALAVFAMTVLALGTIMLIEMTWRLKIDTDKGAVLLLFGMPLDTTRAWPWIAAVLLCIVGFLGLQRTRPFVERQWQTVTTALQRSHS
jgi:branched-chain amino acid transport system permease protein